MDDFVRTLMHLLYHARASTGEFVGGRKLGEVAGEDLRVCLEGVGGNRGITAKLSAADMKLLIAAVARRAIEIVE